MCCIAKYSLHIHSASLNSHTHIHHFLGSRTSEIGQGCEVASSCSDIKPLIQRRVDIINYKTWNVVPHIHVLFSTHLATATMQVFGLETFV